MSTLLNLNTSVPFTGVGTWTYTVPAIGTYTIAVEATLPESSGLSITIKKNAGTVVSTGGATDNPTPTQKSLGAEAYILGAVSDTISVILASSATADKIPGAVKGTINLFNNTFAG